MVSMALGERLGKVDPVRVVGKVEQAKVSQRRTILFNGHGSLAGPGATSKIDDRISYLEGILQSGDLLLGEDGREDLMARIAKLKGGLAII